jgi:small redox-active disulfide protein 2
MKIEVFGIGFGCPTCIVLMKNVQEAIAESGVQVELVVAKDVARAIELGIPAPPGLVIDGVVMSSGRVPSKDEIKKWIKGNV